MAQLAIKGHSTRGSEVIALLEEFGGKNITPKLEGNGSGQIYYIRDSNNEIICATHASDSNLSMVFTLEEFEEKYPYKIGDKVSIDQDTCTVLKRWWDESVNEVAYYIEGTNIKGTTYIKYLKPYKKQEPTKECIDFAKHPPLTDKLEIILGNYEIVQEDGKYYAVRKSPKYPKTHEECCTILQYNDQLKVYPPFRNGIDKYSTRLFDQLENLRKLKICRDAYWKIAGDWKEKRKDKAMHYVIYSTLLGEVVKDRMPNCIANYLLDFPIEEMRDAFYESFKDLIEQCKELL